MDFNNMIGLRSFKPQMPNLDFLLKDPNEANKKILFFLESQSNVANRQFKTSRNLILATILIMFLQIIISVISINQTKEKKNIQERLTEIQLKQSEVVSYMSLNLLDLHNRIKNLEIENDSLLNILNYK